MRHFSRLSDCGLIVVLAVATFAVILRVGLVPRDPAAGVAVIYAPWTKANQTIVRAAGAGARFVRFGGAPFIAIVMPEAPGYVDRVFADSALLVLDPRVLAACLPAAQSEDVDVFRKADAR